MRTHPSTLRRLCAAVLAAAVILLSAVPALPARAEGQLVPMYRLYFPDTHEHFYTGDAHEKSVLAGEQGWIYEGIGWYAPKTGTPVYRLYNPYSRDHHYTTDEYEYNVLGENGWSKEGIGWYSDDEKRVPVYRQFCSALETGTHNYTTDENERNTLIAQGAWVDEGIGWYAAALGAPADPAADVQKVTDLPYIGGTILTNRFSVSEEDWKVTREGTLTNGVVSAAYVDADADGFDEIAAVIYADKPGPMQFQQLLLYILEQDAEGNWTIASGRGINVFGESEGEDNFNYSVTPYRLDVFFRQGFFYVEEAGLESEFADGRIWSLARYAYRENEGLTPVPFAGAYPMVFAGSSGPHVSLMAGNLDEARAFEAAEGEVPGASVDGFLAAFADAGFTYNHPLDEYHPLAELEPQTRPVCRIGRTLRERETDGNMVRAITTDVRLQDLTK